MVLYHFDEDYKTQWGHWPGCPGSMWHSTGMYEIAISQSKFYRPENEHLTWKIDGFNGLAASFEQLDESGRVGFDWQASFQNFDVDVNDT